MKIKDLKHAINGKVRLMKYEVRTEDRNGEKKENDLCWYDWKSNKKIIDDMLKDLKEISNNKTTNIYISNIVRQISNLEEKCYDYCRIKFH